MTITATPSPSTVDVRHAVTADYRALRLCLLSIVAYCGFGLVGFAVLAGFWPPPGEFLDEAGITAYFTKHHDGIKLGMILMIFGAPFYFVWSIALSRIISRIEGAMGPLSMLELLGGLLTALVTLLPPVVWLTAALRPETRSPETVQTLYDFGWMFFDVTFACTVLQNAGLGFGILRDKRATPLIPHWVAWLSFLTAATYFPLVLMPYFKTGPFAWQGLLSFWVVFVMFFLLIAVLTPYAWKALRRLETQDVEAADR